MTFIMDNSWYCRKHGSYIGPMCPQCKRDYKVAFSTGDDRQ